MSSSKPTLEELTAYAAGELSPVEHAGIETRLAQFPDSSRLATRLRGLIQTMRTDDSVAPPAEAIAAAKTIYRPPAHPARQGWLKRVEEVVARLVFDSRVQPALAGVRGSEDGFELTYESDTAVVDLQVDPTPARSGQRHGWRVMGQVSGETPETGTLIIIALALPGSHEPVVETSADAHGMFSLEAEPGRFDLLLHLGSSLMVLPNIEIA